MPIAGDDIAAVDGMICIRPRAPTAKPPADRNSIPCGSAHRPEADRTETTGRRSRGTAKRSSSCRRPSCGCNRPAICAAQSVRPAADATISNDCPNAAFVLARGHRRAQFASARSGWPICSSANARRPGGVAAMASTSACAQQLAARQDAGIHAAASGAPAGRARSGALPPPRAAISAVPAASFIRRLTRDAQNAEAACRCGELVTRFRARLEQSPGDVDPVQPPRGETADVEASGAWLVRGCVLFSDAWTMRSASASSLRMKMACATSARSCAA